MKKLHFSIFAIAACISIISCSKEKDQGITREEAASVIEASIADSYGGLGMQTMDAIATFTPFVKKCDTTISGAFHRENLPFSSVIYSFDFEYSKEFVCNDNDKLEEIHSTHTFSGNFEGPRVSSNTNSNSDWHITGLSILSTSYTFSGNYHRDGSYSVTRRNESLSFEGSLDLNTNNLQVEKLIGHIQGGSSSVHLTGTTSGGRSIDYNADITYHGDGTATVTINGKSFDIKVW